MASPNEMKITEQQSNDHNPSMPPIPMLTIAPSIDIARGKHIQAENEVEGLTPTAHTISTKDHYSEQSEGSLDQVEASTMAMATPIDGIKSQLQSLMGAVTVAPLQWIITTPENYGLYDGQNEGLSDSDSNSGSSDAGDEKQSDSVSDDGEDDEQPDSDSGDNDDDEDEEGKSDSGDADSDGESGDADDEQSGSDSGDSDDEDEDQSDSDSDDDGEEEENEEEEAEEEEEEENMDVDDENTATPTGVNTDDGGNNSSSTPGSIEINHRDAERSDPGTPNLTSGSSEEDSDVSNNRDPVTATSLGLENRDGESSDVLEYAHGLSLLRTMQRVGVRMDNSRTARTPTSNASDQGNANSGQNQNAALVGREQAAEENGGAVSSDVPSEENAPGSSQEDEDMKSDSEEHEVSGTLSLRGGAGEPDMEAYLDEEETEPTGSESDLLPAEVPETPPRTTDSAREAQESGVTPNQDTEEDASESDIEACHGEEEIEPRGSRGRLLPSEIPETPPRGRHGEDPTDSDRDGGEAVSSPEIGTSRYPGYQRSEVDSEDTHEPAGPSEQDFNDDASEDTQEPAGPSEQDSDDDASEPEWDADCIEADHIQYPDENPESAPRSAQRLGDNLADFDLDEGEEIASGVDRVAILTGYRRSEADDEDDQAYEYQGGESSIDRQQTKGKSNDFSPNDEDDQADGDQSGESSVKRQQSKEKESDFSPQSKGKSRALIPTDPTS